MKVRIVKIRPAIPPFEMGHYKVICEVDGRKYKVTLFKSDLASEKDLMDAVKLELEKKIREELGKKRYKEYEGLEFEVK